ncbi:hypothetical protein [Pseudomonas plecoglossicida]|nr:hypothetical protein [Pseudomonas plecoglossicida]
MRAHFESAFEEVFDVLYPQKECRLSIASELASDIANLLGLT